MQKSVQNIHYLFFEILFKHRKKKISRVFDSIWIRIVVRSGNNFGSRSDNSQSGLEAVWNAL